MPHIGFLDTARNFLGLANKWGTTGGNPLRGLFSAVIPVTVVERFRDTDEGGPFGLTGFTAGFGTSLFPVRDAEFPAVCFTSPTTDWELHRVNISFDRAAPSIPGGLQLNYQEFVEMYTPFAPYNPCQNNTTGLFRPGLIGRVPFVFGGVFATAGTNLFLPSQPEGFILCDSDSRSNNSITRWRGDVVGGNYVLSGGDVRVISDDFKLQNTTHFDDPPIRVPRGFILAFQRKNFPAYSSGIHALQNPFDLSVSILYTESPDRRG